MISYFKECSDLIHEVKTRNENYHIPEPTMMAISRSRFADLKEGARVHLGYDDRKRMFERNFFFGVDNVDIHGVRVFCNPLMADDDFVMYDQDGKVVALNSYYPITIIPKKRTDLNAATTRQD